MWGCGGRGESRQRLSLISLLFHLDRKTFEGWGAESLITPKSWCQQKALGQSENKSDTTLHKSQGVCIFYCSVPIHMKKLSEKGLTL